MTAARIARDPFDRDDTAVFGPRLVDDLVIDPLPFAVSPEFADELVRRIFEVGLLLSSSVADGTADHIDRVLEATDRLDQLVSDIRRAVFPSA